MRLDEAKLSTYLDNELPQHEHKWVEKQLLDSPEAQARLARLRQETEQVHQSLNLLNPPPHARPSTWLALKQLQAHLARTSQVTTSPNGKPPENPTLTVWESPTPLTEIKTGLKNFQLKWRQPMRNKVVLTTGLSIIMIMLTITFALWSGIGSPIAEQAQQIFQLAPQTDIPLLPAIPADNFLTDNNQLPQDVIPISLPISYEKQDIGFGYGIQADPYGDTNANINHIKTLGFEWIKFKMDWKDVEPKPGQYDWVFWDKLILAHADNGIKVMLTIVKAPDWARPSDDDKSVEGLPEDPKHYAEFGAKVAQRYQGRVQAIEIWDEINLFYEVGGKGRVNPASYTELLKAAYTTIKSVDPNIVVVSGAPVPTGAPPPMAMDDIEYLNRMYAHGAKDYFDALGAHPMGFANPPDALWIEGDYDPSRGYDDHRSFFFRNTLAAYREVMIENDDQEKMIWATEFGWPVWRYSGDNRFIFARENTLQEQAEYTVKAFEMGQEWGWVGPMFLWNLDYNVTTPNKEAANFGIIDTPTYEALVAMNGNKIEPTDNLSGNDQSISLPNSVAPSYETTPVTAPEDNINIVIVLDISGSMAAEDFEPNRLGAAQTVIQDFIDKRPGERVGFVTFASEVIGQIQPTLDHTMLKAAVNATQLSWDIGLDSGTAIGLGLTAATDMLRDSTASNKIIVLLTDGANNSGAIEPLTAAQSAKSLDIRVYTIGAAQPGPARLPFPDGRVEYRDSEIDEDALQEIADLTGGLYFRAEDTQGLQEVYNKINELEAVDGR